MNVRNLGFKINIFPASASAEIDNPQKSIKGAKPKTAEFLISVTAADRDCENGVFSL
jgi:hypothetical protein